MPKHNPPQDLRAEILDRLIALADLGDMLLHCEEWDTDLLPPGAVTLAATVKAAQKTIAKAKRQKPAPSQTRPYRIIVATDGDELPRWTDLVEGPWDDFPSARSFANNEVGVPWIILEDGRPVCYGDARGTCSHDYVPQ